jgi:trk system potassium uptake protein TrkH
MAQFIGSLEQHPARVSFAWYAATIVLGALLLMQPWCGSNSDKPITAMDAVFTATSATCVTGLAVRSTGHDFSWWGQFVILTLVQLGGIGIMTVTTSITFQLGGRQGLRQRAIIEETLGADEGANVRWVLGRVIRLTVLIEAAGAVLLFARFLFDYPRQPFMALWHAVFHSVTAFCNAGFGLHDDNLVRYQNDWLVNWTIILLIVTGGIGYPVLIDIQRNWRGTWSERWERMLLHSKIMLVGTASLLIFGAVMVLVLEWDGVLKEMPLPQKFLAACFHSTTCRTAGFNTVDVGALSDTTLFISILLMAIGTGPCSTGGGFKVSTLMILVLRGWTTFRGFRQVTVARRTVPDTATDRAIAATLAFGAVAILGLTMLVAVEARGARAGARIFMDATFEAVSALGTVGLSTGITPHLSTLGRLIIIGLMFIGRLGPITFFVALSQGERRRTIEYVSEEPLIG